MRRSLLLVLILISFVNSTLDADLKRQLHEKPHYDVVVHVKSDDFEAFLQHLDQSTRILPRLKRLQHLKERIIEYTNQHQASLHRLLQHSDWISHHSNQTQTLWLVNAISIPQASPALVEKLEAHDAVHSMAQNIQTHQDRIVADPLPPWGLDRIRAQQVHRELGITGKGVIVGILDTKAVLHPSVFENPLGYNIGQDPDKSTAEFDHGTSVASVAVGRHIGVAPDAGLIACNHVGTLVQTLECASMFICPNQRCELTPSIVNHSYGVRGNETRSVQMLRLMIDCFKLFNIINVSGTSNMKFNGEMPREICTGRENRVTYPANFEDVISVGATDEDDRLARFSAQGQQTEGYLKPQLVAPGVDAKVAMSKANEFGFSDGVSFSAPMVTGTIALMLSAVKNLNDVSYELVLQTLQKTTRLDVGKPHFDCSEFFSPQILFQQFPNPIYGAGLIDAYEAVRVFMKKKGKRRVNPSKRDNKREETRIKGEFEELGESGGTDLYNAVDRFRKYTRWNKSFFFRKKSVVQQKYKTLIAKRQYVAPTFCLERHQYRSPSRPSVLLACHLS